MTQQVRTVVREGLDQLQYDNNGNVVYWTAGGVAWNYEWDWADRLVKAASNGVVMLQNWYDANGRRVAKQEVVNGQTKKWLYLYDGWDIVGVMNENGQILETFTRGVGLGGDIGTLIAVTHHTGSAVTPGTYYAHHNHRGDVVLTRSGTTTVGTYSYSAFGSLKSQSGTDVCRFKFSSKERDNSTGFSYYGYRFYAPQWQRWLNRDPIGERGGLNLYKCVGNNPLNFVDPHGLWTTGELAGIIGAGIGGAVEGLWNLSQAPASESLGAAWGWIGWIGGGTLSYGHNATQIENHPFSIYGDATLGHFISYRVDMGPNSSDPCRLPFNYTYGQHEEQHTYQYEALRDWFLPVYFTMWVYNRATGHDWYEAWQNIYLESGPNSNPPVAFP